jgi:hypothetical protein
MNYLKAEKRNLISKIIKKRKIKILSPQMQKMQVKYILKIMNVISLKPKNNNNNNNNMKSLRLIN